MVLQSAYAIGFAPSSKNVYFTNNRGEDYFTFSNHAGETYTCSMELNNSQVGATYSQGNPFTTAETSFQIIATYTVPPGFIPNTVTMTARCTKGAGGQQSIVSEFNRQLGFLLQPTTTTIPTTTTTIPPTTIIPPMTTSSIIISIQPVQSSTKKIVYVGGGTIAAILLILATGAAIRPRHKY